MMEKITMNLLMELINYWMDDLTEAAYNEGYLSSSYEVSGVEGLDGQIKAEKRKKDRLRKTIIRYILEITESEGVHS